MEAWQPTPLEEVKRYLDEDFTALHPHHRMCFESIRVQPISVPVDSNPGEYVYVVAKFGERLLYWSDIEEAWEVASPTASGGIAARGSNQFELSHIMHQLFGDPTAA